MSTKVCVNMVGDMVQQHSLVFTSFPVDADVDLPVGDVWDTQVKFFLFLLKVRLQVPLWEQRLQFPRRGRLRLPEPRRSLTLFRPRNWQPAKKSKKD